MPSLLLPLLLLPSLQAPAPAPQDPDLAPARTVSEILVTASRHEETPLEVPRGVNVVSEQELRRRHQAVAVDALRLEPGIWVEHRSGTSGDLVIRGLSGGNLLALVDGNTLSTFWGEGGFAGDDMYGKVDPWSLERIEVVRGPASVLYGSNALGGVVNFITRKPPLDYTEGGSVWGGELRLSYGFNNNARRERVDLWGANPFMRWRVGGSLGAYDDYQDGSGRTLSHTGGREGNLDWNSEFRLSDEEWLVLDVQKVHRDPVYRHYRTTQWNSNDRQGVNLELHSSRETALWESAFVRLYHQDKEDWRYWTNGDEGVARWRTWTADAQAEAEFGDHELTYGLAFHLDRGESPDDEQFTMYPGGGGPAVKAAPDSDWWNLGAFVQDEWDFAEDWSLLAAARYDHFLFRSTPDKWYTPPAGSPKRLDDIRSTEGALTGGLALTRWFGESFHLYTSWYRGFRQFAPNFGIRQHGWGVLVPNGLLEPVSSDTYELGAKFEEETLTAEAILYRTDFSNFQNIVAGSYQGSKFYDFNNNGTFEADERVYRTTANGDAFVHGVELAGQARLDRFFDSAAACDWWLGGSFMWNIGQDETNEVPLRHTVPVRGVVSVLWEPRDSRNGLYCGLDVEMVNAFTRIDPARLGSDVGYLSDPQDPTSGQIRPWGLPGYTLVHLRGGYTLDNGVELFAVIDNAGGVDYRAAHSRADGIGMNLTVGAAVPF
ncbi:MAG: TonB-dependent receptor [Planctomycetes bacterium]|nr:TonB-dependent receptor [Planctomycetota bacterium]MBL7007495.1 TonB-dependent receptor [Planctomycetota bacterium]